MITLERARELLKQAMETQGRDFVYNVGGGGVCCYTTEDARVRLKGDLLPEDSRLVTGCLVGVALDLAGHTEHHGSNECVDRLGIPMEPAVIEYLSAAQTTQDQGRTWGEAFDEAEISIGAMANPRDEE